MEYRPLVSVVVVAYNSSSFIAETLESIRGQTYSDIELIIADDCSRDDTAGICNHWLLENKDRFVKNSFITSLTNGGIAQNCNNGVGAASGEWIKLIAGDDILLEICVADFVDFAGKNRLAKVIFSDLYFINDASETIGEFPSRKDFYASPAEKQLELLVYDNQLPACAGFINRETLIKEGGFDPTYPMMEDYPFWIKLSSRKYKMEYLEKFTVGYRVHGGMTSVTAGKVNKNFLRASMAFSLNIRLPLAKQIFPHVVSKVKRDILMTRMRLLSPRVAKILWPVLWWFWKTKKEIKWKR